MTPVSKKPPLTPEEQAKQERRFYFHMGGLLCLLSPFLSIVYGTLIWLSMVNPDRDDVIEMKKAMIFWGQLAFVQLIVLIANELVVCMAPEGSLAHIERTSGVLGFYAFMIGVSGAVFSYFQAVRALNGEPARYPLLSIFKGVLK